MRVVLSLIAATLAALTMFTGAATAKKRCCFKVTIDATGFVESHWGLLSDDQIGDDVGLWSWTERMILVYSESGSTNFPDFRLARLGNQVVKPSTVTALETRSTVQFGGPGFYTPVTKPGDCGKSGAKLRRGNEPEFVPRSQADDGELAGFPNAKMFLRAGDSYLVQDQYCLYGHNLNNVEVWEDKPCDGQGAFALPAPRRGWFRNGEKRIAKKIRCEGTHGPEVNVNHSTLALGDFTVFLSWFPPSKLEKQARALKKKHKGAVAVRPR